MRKGLVLLCCELMCFAASVHAQEQENWALRTADAVKQRLDSALVRKVDTNYIEVPEKPWRVILHPKVSQVYATLHSSFDEELLNKLANDWEIPLSLFNISWSMRLNQPMSASVGFWVGYRGLGIGYAQSLTKHTGRHLTFSSSGSHYGLSFSFRHFSTDDLSVKMKEEVGDYTEDINFDYRSYDPVWISSAFVDGYYVFNGKRYSQAAAYNQSVIQRRSAGSFLLGLSWYQSSIDYSNKLNGDIILAANNIGKMKIHQGNIGFGYGYNWVPARNWLVNIMVMPTVSVYNRVKATKYASNYNFALQESETEDYGTWDSEKRQWSNGRSERPVPENIDEDHEDLSWQSDVEMWESGTSIEHTHMKVNVNGRASVAYFGKNCFASFNGQLHRFSYSHDETQVRLYDWFLRGSLGIRF